jgi:hypothetical protein
MTKGPFGLSRSGHAIQALGGGSLTEVFQKSEAGVEALRGALGGVGAAALGADETEALDDAFQHLALLGFEVIFRGGALAGMQGEVEFLFETDGVGPFPGGENLFGVLRYVHDDFLSRLYRRGMRIFEENLGSWTGAP